MDEGFTSFGNYGRGRDIAFRSGRVYWANNSTGAIERANSDGTAIEERFITGISDPGGIAVDARHVYWANRGVNSTGTIGRANLDGSGVDRSFIRGRQPAKCRGQCQAHLLVE